MAAAVSELNPKSRSRSDRERFGEILAVQRAAYLRDGAPSLTKRRGALKKFKAAMLARRSAIEEAINTDFGHRSRHETAIMEILGVVQGIDYLVRNLGPCEVCMRSIAEVVSFHDCEGLAYLFGTLARRSS